MNRSRAASPRGISALLALLVGALLVISGCSADGASVESGDGDASEAPADDGAGDGEATDAEPATAEDEPAEESEAPADEVGTRENPGQPGDVVTITEQGEPTWEVTLGNIDPDAWPEIQAANEFNEPPTDGQTYVMVPVTATYVGEESGLPWTDLRLQFVTPEGNAFEQAPAVAPDDLTNVSDLYPDATGEGNVVFLVPTDGVEGGTISVESTLDMSGNPPAFIEAVPAS